jgi:hypothetical protein
VSWDGFQRAVLAELGHVLYRLPDAPSTPAGPAASGVEMTVDASMLARLARAAGVAPEALLAQADIAALSAGLRGDAAAKRALWPRLRALRRSAQR